MTPCTKEDLEVRRLVNTLIRQEHLGIYPKPVNWSMYRRFRIADLKADYREQLFRKAHRLSRYRRNQNGKIAAAKSRRTQ
jgi:hypothetical protein